MQNKFEHIFSWIYWIYSLLHFYMRLTGNLRIISLNSIEFHFTRWLLYSQQKPACEMKRTFNDYFHKVCCQSYVLKLLSIYISIFSLNSSNQRNVSTKRWQTTLSNWFDIFFLLCINFRIKLLFSKSFFVSKCYLSLNFSQICPIHRVFHCSTQTMNFFGALTRVKQAAAVIEEDENWRRWKWGGTIRNCCTCNWRY